ncbi:MAG: hypothetical protein ACM3RX_00305 [Methanococcaceae archaeon]
MGLESNAVESAAINSANSGNQVQQEISMKVLKQKQSEAEHLVQKLIIEQQPAATPKSMHATFEKIM